MVQPKPRRLLILERQPVGYLGLKKRDSQSVYLQPKLVQPKLVAPSTPKMLRDTVPAVRTEGHSLRTLSRSRCDHAPASARRPWRLRGPAAAVPGRCTLEGGFPSREANFTLAGE